MGDNVNSPIHYTEALQGTPLEPIFFTEQMNFCVGNVFKYVARAGLKHPNAVEDYSKALYYMRRHNRRLLMGGEPVDYMLTGRYQLLLNELYVAKHLDREQEVKRKLLHASLMIGMKQTHYSAQLADAVIRVLSLLVEEKPNVYDSFEMRHLVQLLTIKSLRRCGRLNELNI